MSFEIGQEIEFHSFDGTWKRAKVVDDLKDGRYLINDGGVEFARLSNVLRAIPDDGKQSFGQEYTIVEPRDDEQYAPGEIPVSQELIDDYMKQFTPVQYPPMRAMVGAKPLSTWQQVLADKPLAASQPHLYLLGHYRSDIYDLEQFAKDTPRFILMSTIACSNAAIGGSETQPYHIVFVITEGE